MIATQTLPAVGSLHLDSTLAAALVLSWSDLMPELTSGLIHVEYHVGSHGEVEYLKVWAALTRGQWNLVCQDFMGSSASCQGGFRFANGYKSEGLAKMLNQILQHPEMFPLGCGPWYRSHDTDPPADAEGQTCSTRDGGRLWRQIGRVTLSGIPLLDYAVKEMRCARQKVACDQAVACEQDFGKCSSETPEKTMTWESVEEKWKQLIGSARENWNKLTDQDLEQISGKREPLISKIRETYGITRREAGKQVWDWGKSVEHSRKTIA